MADSWCSGLGREAVTPTEEQLCIEDPICCPVIGCEQEFLSSSRLLMHTLRRHEGRTLSTAVAPGNKNKIFFCPVEQCGRSKGGRPFSRLGKLKQHYQTVHGKKEFECSRCGKRFGLRDMCQRHERECGRVFQCLVCEDEFRSKNALYQHAKRKGHKPPSSSSDKDKQNSSSSNNPHPIIIAPIIIKTVLPIPKISVPSLSTSTFVQTSTTRENVPDTDIHSTIATQTILDSFLSPAVHQACQTQTVPSNDFGTQTLLLASRAVSPPPTLLSSDQSPITIREDELCFSELLPPECMEFGTQTLDTSLEDIACLDFGVQTLLTSGTKDQSSQTLP